MELFNIRVFLYHFIYFYEPWYELKYIHLYIGIYIFYTNPTLAKYLIFITVLLIFDMF